MLEPVQQAAESVVVGRLGVEQLGAVGLGTVLFQFALGFMNSLVRGGGVGGGGRGVSRGCACLQPRRGITRGA